MNNNCGVYAIINTVNQKLYIGSSKNLKNRKYNHFFALKNNKHPNEYLQNAWNKHGKQAFNWAILCYCKENTLLEKEQYYINYYQACNPNCGYNLSLRADRIKLTEESLEKMRKKLSEVMKVRMLSKETREKLRQANLGKKLSLEHIEKIRYTKLKYKHLVDEWKKLKKNG